MYRGSSAASHRAAAAVASIQQPHPMVSRLDHFDESKPELSHLAAAAAQHSAAQAAANRYLKCLLFLSGNNSEINFLRQNVFERVLSALFKG